MKTYCTQNDGQCQTCSLANYSHDCRNHVILTGHVSEIELECRSYFGGVSKVRIDESGPKIISDDRDVADGYLQFPSGPPPDGPTPALQEALARIYLSRPDDCPPLGQSVCQWAFLGLTPDDLSSMYSGQAIYLA